MSHVRPLLADLLYDEAYICQPCKCGVCSGHSAIQSVYMQDSEAKRNQEGRRLFPDRYWKHQKGIRACCVGTTTGRRSWDTGDKAACHSKTESDSSLLYLARQYHLIFIDYQPAVFSSCQGEEGNDGTLFKILGLDSLLCYYWSTGTQTGTPSEGSGRSGSGCCFI